jgi:hypothetical protein
MGDSKVENIVLRNLVDLHFDVKITQVEKLGRFIDSYVNRINIFSAADVNQDFRKVPTSSFVLESEKKT